jgi:hypothetical protein
MMEMLVSKLQAEMSDSWIRSTSTAILVSMAHVTQILSDIEPGDPSAACRGQAQAWEAGADFAGHETVRC